MNKKEEKGKILSFKKKQIYRQSSVKTPIKNFKYYLNVNTLFLHFHQSIEILTSLATVTLILSIYVKYPKRKIYSGKDKLRPL